MKIKHHHKKNALFSLLTTLLFLTISPLAAQETATLNGRILDSTTGRPAPFATIVIMEAAKKARAEDNGSYTIQLEPGKYNVIIASPGLKTLNVSITVSAGATKRDFYLAPLTVQGGAIQITGERDVQKVSRYTLTAQDLKEVPGSFGDSLNALASLPGIIRSNGFLGDLVIRGYFPEMNRYYLDDMPIYQPQHFGGLHSVINNDLISEIDVFSSAYSADVAGGGGPVIRINTVDEVEEFSGNAEVNLLSANVVVKGPIGEGLPHQGILPTADETQKKKEKPLGYYALGGRISYWDLAVPPMYYLMTGEELSQLPRYYDYQGKFRYYPHKDHSFAILVAGSSDDAYYLDESTETDNLKRAQEGEDPTTFNFEALFDVASQNIGTEYRYKPTQNFSNRTTAFAAFSQTNLGIDMPNSAALDDVYIRTNPNTFGLKNTTEAELFDKTVMIRAGGEANYFDYKYESKSVAPTGASTVSGESIDLNDPSSFTVYESDTTTTNVQYGAFSLLRLKKWGATLEPGIRADYLNRTKETTVDPRGKIVYDFPTDTTISVALGQYSMFLQTNPYYFSNIPELSAIDYYIKPYQSMHRVVGIEQRYDLYLVKLEGFYNDTYNYYTPVFRCESGTGVPQEDFTCDDGSTFYPGYNNGQLHTAGFEVLLRKDKRAGKADYYGWLSYTYSQSRFKSGIPGDVTNTLDVSQYDQPHNLKLVLGYIKGSHTISGKFQVYSGFPYNPIVGGYLDTSYEATKPSNFPSRYAPIYDDSLSKRYGINHQLDLRYSHKDKHSWGHITWYVEVINVYAFILQNLGVQPKAAETWKYNEPYESGVNPVSTGDPLAFTIPNFGIEVKF